MYEEIDYETAGEEIRGIAHLIASDVRLFLERYTTTLFLRVRVEGFWTLTKNDSLYDVVNHSKFISIQNGIDEGKLPFMDFVFKLY